MDEQPEPAMPSASATLVRAFWKLCTFRIGPQDIPASSALLILASIANLVLSTLINQMQLTFSSALLVALMEMGVLIGLTVALLFYFSHMPRLSQTLTALMGSGALIGGIVMGLLLAFPRLPELLRILIFFWNLLVMAHILRHALGVHVIAAFFMAVGYAIFLIQLIVFIGRALGTGV